MEQVVGDDGVFLRLGQHLVQLLLRLLLDGGDRFAVPKLTTEITPFPVLKPEVVGLEK